MSVFLFAHDGSPQEVLGLRKIERSSNFTTTRSMRSCPFSEIAVQYSGSNSFHASGWLAHCADRLLGDEGAKFWDFLVIIALDIVGPDDFILNPNTVNYSRRADDTWPYEADPKLQQQARNLIAEKVSEVFSTEEADIGHQEALITFWANSHLHCHVSEAGKAAAHAFLQSHDTRIRTYLSACANMDFWDPFDLMEVYTYRQLCDLIEQTINHHMYGMPRGHQWFHKPPMDLEVLRHFAPRLEKLHPRAADFALQLCNAWRDDPHNIKAERFPDVDPVEKYQAMAQRR